MSEELGSSMATRPDLLLRLRDWSQQTAWEEFDRTYGKLILNVCRKAGLSGVEAQEVAQQTLITVAQKLGQFEHAGHPGAFRAWLYQLARWRIADQFRARARSRRLTALHLPESLSNGRTEFGDSDGSCGQASGHPEAVAVDPILQQVWDEEWEAHLRQSALAVVKQKVSPRQFQLFDLHVLQGTSVQDTARAAGASVASVYMAKSRVGRLLKREIQALKAMELKRCS